MVEHFLLNCELYDEERDLLRRRVGLHGMVMSALLGDSQIIKETMEYIEKTGQVHSLTETIKGRYRRRSLCTERKRKSYHQSAQIMYN